MRKHRAFFAALLSIWLVLGPAGAAWASGETQCESMMGMLPADDCCGDGKAALTSCAGVCAAPAMGTEFIGPNVRAGEPAGIVPFLEVRYATRAAPPDIAPPKAVVS